MCFIGVSPKPLFLSHCERLSRSALAYAYKRSFDQARKAFMTRSENSFSETLNGLLFARIIPRV